MPTRKDAGLGLDVASVASVFISRWDAAVAGKLPAHLSGRLGVAIAKRTYKAYRDLLGSERWQKLAAALSESTAPSRSCCPTNGGDAEEVLSRIAAAGVDVEALAATLQAEGANAFVKSWDDLLGCIGSKAEQVRARS